MQINNHEQGNHLPANTTQQAEIETQRVNVPSYYELYLMKAGANCFWAKVFLQKFDNNYQKEKNTLANFNHPNIVQTVQQNTSEYIRASSILNNKFLLFPLAQNGDLLNYIQKYGSFPEKVTSFYIKQLVSALIYARQKNIQHPNLVVQNLLMNKERDILLCGWSNSLNKKEENIQTQLFGLGEIIIYLCTSRTPFVSKGNDPYSRLLNESHIHKFWQQFEKALINQQIKLSPSFKQLISNLFLKKIKSYEDLIKNDWFSQTISKEDLCLFLNNAQEKYIIRRKERQNTIRRHQNQEKQCLQDNQNSTGSRCVQYFCEEFQGFQKGQLDIEEKSSCDKKQYTVLFDNNPKIVISHLRAKLRSIESEQESIIDPLLLLRQSQIKIQGNTLKINTIFGWNYNLLEDKCDIYPGIKYSAEFHLKKYGGNLIGLLEVTQENELNSICMMKFNQWIINEIKLHPLST